VQTAEKRREGDRPEPRAEKKRRQSREGSIGERWNREKETGWRREQQQRTGEKETGPSPEQRRSGDRGERDRSVNGGIASPERERERERVDERDGKILKMLDKISGFKKNK
jgi:hypothetical protein